MHYYNFHIGDYASHTRHLSHMEDLAFRRLLDFYYLHETPIKTHDIARQIGMREHEQDVLTVLNEFFMSTPEGFINGRADKEIEHFHAKVEQASRAGKASAERRSNVRSTDVQPTNNQEPLTNNHKPKKEKATAVATPDGVDVNLWNDFLVLRKAKSLPVTQTVVNQIKAQGEILGWTLTQTLTEQISRGWGGFKASWIQKEQASNPADRIHMTVPGKQERDPALVKLDNDAKATIPMPTNIKEQLDKLRRQA